MLAGTLSASAFALGVGLLKLPANVSEIQEKIVVSLLPTTLLATVKVIDSTISREVEAEVEQQIPRIHHSLEQGCKQKYDDRLTQFQQHYAEDLKQLQEDLLAANVLSTLPQQRCDRIKASFAKIQAATDRYDLKGRLYRQITDWFSVKPNRVDLLQWLLAPVKRSQFRLGGYRRFRQDIGECLAWIHYSFVYEAYCRVKPERYASAWMHHCLSDIALYGKVLTRIVDHPSLVSSLTPLSRQQLQDAVEHLVQQITELADQRIA